MQICQITVKGMYPRSYLFLLNNDGPSDQLIIFKKHIQLVTLATATLAMEWRPLLSFLSKTDRSVRQSRGRPKKLVMSNSKEIGLRYERLVRRRLQKGGFWAHRLSSDPRDGGDGGVDIIAVYKKVLFVIQCKNHGRGVEPGAIRELEGVLAGYPMGTVGVLVAPKFGAG
ncbi:6601_t:CDS:2 [Paraglomus brasilianum]|uniref:6601_t:CDS:1 n=1 Tax=Paraglomus brasilianum TaxID=144538 RepID=A0A9N9E5Y4_9GLOM|nr:6601_t:CDS:2 [Paraglomus brasilianum]